MERKLDRRTFLKSTAAIFGGTAVTLSPGLTAFAGLAGNGSSTQGQTTVTWYALDPEWGAGMDGCPVDPAAVHQSTHACHACNSCHLHGENKLFPSMTAADQNRAHVGCKCLVVEGGELPVDTWETLFGAQDNIEREQVDRRWDWVMEALERRAGTRAGRIPVCPRCVPPRLGAHRSPGPKRNGLSFLAVG